MVVRSVLRHAAAWTLCMVLAVGIGTSSGESTPEAVAILMYHHVCDEIESATVVSPEVLEDHIRTLLEAGFCIMSLSELSRWLDEPGNSASGVVLTFDDGYESFYHAVYPLLCKYEVPASCFLIVSSSETPTGQESTCTAVCGHLSFEQARAMVEGGLVELGSHSYDGHKYVDTRRGSRPYLVEPLMDEDHTGFTQRVQMDLIMSRQVLRDMVGVECRYFSYPYGWVTSELRDQVSRCGFDFALTTTPGVVVAGTDRYQLPRITVRPEMSGSDLVAAIKAEMVRARTESRLDGDTSTP